MQLGALAHSLVVGLFLVLGALALVDPYAAEWGALGLIVFAGIPHGAFDLDVARRVWGAHWPPLVVIGLYVLVGVSMSAVCLLAPPLGLVIFLGISVVHFAEGEPAALGALGRYLVGSAAVTLPIAFHLSEAGGYLRFFIEPGAVHLFSSVLRAFGGVVAGGVLIGAVVRLRSGDRLDGVELLVCLAAWCLFPPLAGFAVWFIGRHSRGHLARCREVFARGPRLFTPDAVVISVTAIVLIAPLGFLFDFTVLEELFTASIILIAGLTAPHMAVTHRLDASTRDGASPRR